jgi:hypothetical protein
MSTFAAQITKIHQLLEQVHDHLNAVQTHLDELCHTEPDTCFAREWFGGLGRRCSKKRVDGDYCTRHGKCQLLSGDVRITGRGSCPLMPPHGEALVDEEMPFTSSMPGIDTAVQWKEKQHRNQEACRRRRK